MANVLDVAAYILKRNGPMTTWKLQRLVYYAQAWSLAWDEGELFPEECLAWANGPVVKELFDAHKECFRIDTISGGDPSAITPDQQDSIDQVLDSYGSKSPRWLTELAHLEDPWKHARSGIEKERRPDVVIPKQTLTEYYASLI